MKWFISYLWRLRPQICSPWGWWWGHRASFPTYGPHYSPTMWHSAQHSTSGVRGQSSPPKETHPTGTKAQTWERRSRPAALTSYNALRGRGGGGGGERNQEIRLSMELCVHKWSCMIVPTNSIHCSWQTKRVILQFGLLTQKRTLG